MATRIAGRDAHGLSRRTAQTGLLVAAFVVPQSFASSLTPRSWLDQGIVTGLDTTVNYLLTATTQDVVEAAAGGVAPRLPWLRAAPPASRQRAAALLLDLAIVPIGVAAQRALPRAGDESVVRGLVRQAAWRTTTTGAGAAVFAAVQFGADALDRRIGAGGRIAGFPVAVPAGLALAAALDHRQKKTSHYGPDRDRRVPVAPLQSLAASAGVVGFLTAFAAAEHALAELGGTALARALPGPPQWWRLTGHAAFLGALAIGGGTLFDHIIRGLEAGATRYEPVLGESVQPELIGPTVSGGPGSRIAWATLGREGRRHAFAYVRAAPLPTRPAGLPDLSIETVMGRPARTTPVQVYVGLDSGPDARTRVALAMAELERTDAWDRSLLMLISPTGTGYVNYCAVAATQYLTLGDVATVTLQYSKRPSPLSLGRIGAAREQNRLLMLHVLERLRDRPAGRRPRVVLFGESLGAHTSQDMLMHWGTLGPQALGIDRALWIGTPYSSKWMRQVTGVPRPDVDPTIVGVFNDHAQYAVLPAEDRARLRYVLVSHDNDGVTKFGADLITSRPRWLSPGRPPVQEVPGASPRGVPPAMRWRPLTTFLQTLIDMKNAQVPGAYRAWAHDYRPDLARFIRDVYGLPASDEELLRVEQALEKREAARERLFTTPPAGHDTDIGSTVPR
jgi:uncharacterized membrane protein